MAFEFLTIAVPALNEEVCIAKTVEDLLPEDGDYELLILDGGSTDRTREIVESISAGNPRVRLVDNPGRTQAAAVNLAARVADPRTRTIVRADAHCRYPRGWARAVASALENKRHEGAVSVVVPMLTVGRETRFQKAVAAAQNSRFGNGGSAHRRRAGVSGWIDHGHHAAFDREFFLKIGGYDESFAVNEDAEYDIRVHKAGGRVWMESSALIEYFPRRSPVSLARQYYRYGSGRARTVIKHSARLKLRQAFPVAVFVACAVGVGLTPVLPAALLVPVAYFAACFAAGLTLVAKGEPFLRGLMSSVALSIMHLSWGAGFMIQYVVSKASREFKE